MWIVDRNDENRPRNIVIGVMAIAFVIYLRVSGIIPGVLAIVSPPEKLSASGEASWVYGFVLNNVADAISFIGAGIVMAFSGLWGLLIQLVTPKAKADKVDSIRLAIDASDESMRVVLDARFKRLIEMINASFATSESMAIAIKRLEFVESRVVALNRPVRAKKLVSDDGVKA